MYLVVLIVAGVMGGLLPAPRVGAADDPHRTFDSPNFRVFYADSPSDPDAPDLSDEDGSGIPDSVERFSRALELARSNELGLGFRPPPVEGRYEVFIAQTSGEMVRPIPGGTGLSRPSVIILAPYRLGPEYPDESLEALAAHEYFHAIQYGYNYHGDKWLLEASATWMEEQLVDAFDPGHPWIADFLLTPRAGLEDSGLNREYGAFIFLQYLTERFVGPDLEGAWVIRRLWELMADPVAVPGGELLTSLEAVQTVVRDEFGTDMRTVWREFLEWQRSLTPFREGSSYRDQLRGLGWPTFFNRSFLSRSSCRLTTEDDGPFPPMSGDYAVLRPKRSVPHGTSAKLVLKGSPDSVGYLKTRGKETTHVDIAFDDDGLAEVEIPFFRPRTKRVVVALGNASIDASVPMIDYSLRLTGRPTTVVAQAPQGPNQVVFPASSRLSGSVLCDGVPAPHALLEIVSSDVLNGATETVSLSTDKDGRWDAVLSLDAISEVEVRVVDPLLDPVASDPKRVEVLSGVYLHLASEVLDAGEPLAFTGEVVPAFEGTEVIVEFRRPQASQWLPGTEVVTDADGSFFGSLAFPGSGTWEVRARVTGSPDEQRAPGRSIGWVVYQEENG